MKNKQLRKPIVATDNLLTIVKRILNLCYIAICDVYNMMFILIKYCP